MNWNRIESEWKQYRGQVKQTWGRLTEDDLNTISGRRERLVDKLQERYGTAKEFAETGVEKFCCRVFPPLDGTPAQPARHPFQQPIEEATDEWDGVYDWRRYLFR